VAAPTAAFEFKACNFMLLILRLINFVALHTAITPVGSWQQLMVALYAQVIMNLSSVTTLMSTERHSMSSYKLGISKT